MKKVTRKNKVVYPKVPKDHGDWLSIHFPSGDSFKVPIGGGSKTDRSRERPSDCVALYCRVHPDVYFVVEVILLADGSWVWHDTRPYDNVCSDAFSWQLEWPCEEVGRRRKVREALLAGKCDADPAKKTAWAYSSTKDCIMTKMTIAQRLELGKLLNEEIDLFGTGFYATDALHFWLNEYWPAQLKK